MNPFLPKRWISIRKIGKIDYHKHCGSIELSRGIAWVIHHMSWCTGSRSCYRLSSRFKLLGMQSNWVYISRKHNNNVFWNWTNLMKSRIFLFNKLYWCSKNVASGMIGWLEGSNSSWVSGYSSMIQSLKFLKRSFVHAGWDDMR